MRPNNILWKILIIIAAFAILFYMYITAGAAEQGIESCVLTGGGQSITITGTASGDNVYVVMSRDTDESHLLPLDKMQKSGEKYSITVPATEENGNSRISCMFAMAIQKDGTYIPVGNWHYVTNPELVASHTAPRSDNGIKGILPASTDAQMFNDLGIRQILFNIEFAGVSGTGGNGEIRYHYNGKDYFFSSKRVSEYDGFVKWCADNGYQLTFTLLNAESSKNIGLIHPGADDGTNHPTYAIDTKTTEHCELYRAITSFLANRYSGGEFGTVDNWILGNQVNARTEWYYLSSTDLKTNVEEYCHAFHIFYNEIKSVNANANVYISLDQQWNKKSNPGCFSSREYLHRFAAGIKNSGDIDWGLGIHPYNAPVFDPLAWRQQEMYVTDDKRTPYLTISNIDLLIDEMKSPELLNPAGNVRNIMLSQIGYSSAFGEEYQAASIAYAYNKALQYPEIKGFILYRELDDENEMATSINQGLKTLDGHVKLAYEFYKTAGTPEFAKYTGQFKEITGFDINELVRPGVFHTRQGWDLKEPLPEFFTQYTEKNDEEEPAGN